MFFHPRPVHQHRRRYTVLESKASMKTRGLKSPDRAEASLLAIYRPVLLVSRRRRGILN
jgi:hypothetical protein